MDEYDQEERGIRIIELDDSFQMCTRNEYYEVLSKIVNLPQKHALTDVQLETLSIIAYKQPITRAEIEAIRGVSCVHAINKLVEYDRGGRTSGCTGTTDPVRYDRGLSPGLWCEVNG